jgi:MFS superfamily sulfate permease-like transporter
LYGDSTRDFSSYFWRHCYSSKWTVLSASFIIIAQSGTLESAMGMIIATFMLVGISNYFGLLKIGGYIKYFPYPVVSGFMTGVGLIIILFQIFPFARHLQNYYKSYSGYW